MVTRQVADKVLGEHRSIITDSSICPAPGRIQARGSITTRALHGSISRQTIYSVENDRSDPSLSLAFGLARLFRRPIEEVFHDPGSSPTSGQGSSCPAPRPRPHQRTLTG
ncbi:helix-turn-helix transcriptional regulator [Kocuria sabuli]|uniref:helix-turn-helix transcriptional regulator n=1 Tax=Kocuria sabuli TaxID=3071448 RepID=UPI0034D73E8E